jgi:hypothetical protein
MQTSAIIANSTVSSNSFADRPKRIRTVGAGGAAAGAAAADVAWGVSLRAGAIFLNPSGRAG